MLIIYLVHLVIHIMYLKIISFFFISQDLAMMMNVMKLVMVLFS